MKNYQLLLISSALAFSLSTVHAASVMGQSEQSMQNLRDAAQAVAHKEQANKAEGQGDNDEALEQVRVEEALDMMDKYYLRHDYINPAMRQYLRNEIWKDILTGTSEDIDAINHAFIKHWHQGVDRNQEKWAKALTTIGDYLRAINGARLSLLRADFVLYEYFFDGKTERSKRVAENFECLVGDLNALV